MMPSVGVGLIHHLGLKLRMMPSVGVEIDSPLGVEIENVEFAIMSISRAV